MPRFRQAERDEALSETRQRLLRAAAQEFAREGYSVANINRISEAAGFSKGTVYNYFASKRELMLALIDQIGAEHIAFVEAQVKLEKDPERRLQRFFTAGFAYVADHPAQAQVMMTTLYGSDMEFQEHLFHLYQPMFQLVGAEILALGIQLGTFRPVDPANTASLLMTIYLGSSSRVDENGKPYLDPDQVADFTLHALRTRANGTD